MKLNQRIEVRAGQSDATIVATCWCSVELASIGLHKASVGAVNKYSYLIHIRKHTPYGRIIQPHNQVLYDGKTLDIDTISETQDGTYLRLLCTVAGI